MSCEGIFCEILYAVYLSRRIKSKHSQPRPFIQERAMYIPKIPTQTSTKIISQTTSFCNARVRQ